MWLVSGPEEKIVVDLGPPDPQQVLSSRGFVMERSGRQHPEAALSGVGVHPEEITTVVMTHLHWDHAWGFDLFKNARFVVQKREIEYAVAPLPCHRSLYYEDAIGKPQAVDYLERIRIIDGDEEIAPGIDAVFLPGHTPGFQGVGIGTESGYHLIAGDAVGLYECMESVPYIPSGLFNNLDVYYRSLEKIHRIADVVLPGHDMKVFDKPSYP